MNPLILHNGIVHSPTDPYATALLVEDGVIAWLGSEETVDQIAADAQRVDLEGGVVTPLFVDPLRFSAGPSGEDDHLAGGLGVVTMLTGPEEAGATGEGAPGTDVQASQESAAARLVYRHLEGRAHGALGVWLAADQLEPAALADALVEAVQAGEQPYLVAEQCEDLDARDRAHRHGLQALRTAEQRLGVPALGRVRPRLVVDGRLDDEDVALLGATASSVTLAPHDGVFRAPVGSLLAAGVPVCLAASGIDTPWTSMQAAMHHPVESERISARSAFAAVTRAGLRAAADTPLAATLPPSRLTVSAAARLAVWRADAVGVQAPDSRVAAWSTDTRAGTPLLPDLDSDAALPRLVAALWDGRAVAGSLTRG